MASNDPWESSPHNYDKLFQKNTKYQVMGDGRRWAVGGEFRRIINNYHLNKAFWNSEGEGGTKVFENMSLTATSHNRGMVGEEWIQEEIHKKYKAIVTREKQCYSGLDA